MKKRKMIICLFCLTMICSSCTVNSETDALSRIAGQMDIQRARQSAVLSNAAYSPGTLHEELEILGFPTDTIVQKDYDTNALHSTAVTFARRKVKDQAGHVSTEYVIVLRGTMTMQEAISNLVLGSGDAATGFQLAAERVYGHWEAYIAQYPPMYNGAYTVWICGHSRGGAVANLLGGAYFPKQMAKERVFAYTFGAPLVQKTTDPNANVFNFIFDGDVMTRVPPEVWGYARHGKDIHCDQRIAAEIIVNSKEDTDRLIKTLLSGGLSPERYQDILEPILRILQGSSSAETINTTEIILPFLQFINDSDIEDRMNLVEIMEYLPGVMPSHVMSVYLKWMDRIE